MRDRKVMIARAFQMIETVIGPILASSALYETEAWGNREQSDFINVAIVVEYYGTPSSLLNKIHKIEIALGRKREEKWGPRIIDIDILFFQDHVMQSQKLTIPHPMLQDRRFVLAPLAEIAPDLEHPILRKSVQELLDACQDHSVVTRLKQPV